MYLANINGYSLCMDVCFTIWNVYITTTGICDSWCLDDEFILIWSAESVVQSKNYPGFMGKVSNLTDFPHELGCEDFTFLDHGVDYFECGLKSAFIDSSEIPELDAFFDELDNIASSVFLMFLCSDSTFSYSYSPLWSFN